MMLLRNYSPENIPISERCINQNFRRASYPDIQIHCMDCFLGDDRAGFGISRTVTRNDHVMTYFTGYNAQC